MRLEILNGLVRGQKPPASSSTGKDSPRAPGLLKRNFSEPHPNHPWITDFHYVPTWGGFVYVAFAIDLYSRSIVGWHTSTVKDTPFVEACLKMALWRRDNSGHAVEPGMIHHSDAGSQGRFNWSSQRPVITEVLACSSSASSGKSSSTEVEISGTSEVPAHGRVGVLGRDCQGPSGGRRCPHCGRGASGRNAVPAMWRHETLDGSFSA